MVSVTVSIDLKSYICLDIFRDSAGPHQEPGARTPDPAPWIPRPGSRAPDPGTVASPLDFDERGVVCVSRDAPDRTLQGNQALGVLVCQDDDHIVHRSRIV